MLKVKSAIQVYPYALNNYNHYLTNSSAVVIVGFCENSAIRGL